MTCEQRIVECRYLNKCLLSINYSGVITSAMSSHFTGVSFVYLSVCSGVDEWMHQSFASLVFRRGIHRSLVNSPHKGPVTRKMFSIDDVIMIRCCGHSLVGQWTNLNFQYWRNRLWCRMSICQYVCLSMLVTWQYKFVTLRKYGLVTLRPESKSPPFLQATFSKLFPCTHIVISYFEKIYRPHKMLQPNSVIIVSADVCRWCNVIRCNDVYNLYYIFKNCLRNWWFLINMSWLQVILFSEWPKRYYEISYHQKLTRWSHTKMAAILQTAF